jgi:hypothetical protein
LEQEICGTGRRIVGYERVGRRTAAAKSCAVCETRDCEAGLCGEKKEIGNHETRILTATFFSFVPIRFPLSSHFLLVSPLFTFWCKAEQIAFNTRISRQKEKTTKKKIPFC